jgi:beta-glucuronidase
MDDGQSAAPGGRPGVSRRQAVGVLGVLAAGSAASTAGAQSPVPLPVSGPASLLYPHESATRSTKDLSGLWKFQLDPEDKGEKDHWFDGLPAPRKIPVPCSWNDLFDDAQDYFGAGWYETEIWLDQTFKGRRAVIRFGSAVYHARVWLNGRYLGEHMGGHLPFAFDITADARTDQANRLIVCVENKLKLDRVPAVPDPGTAHFYQEDYPQTTYDFFPYAGLHRPVLLCALPDTHLHDVTVKTDLRGTDGLVNIAFTVSGGWSGKATLTLGGGGEPVTVTTRVHGGQGLARLSLRDVRAWSPKDPFLYRLTVSIGSAGAPIDDYHMKIGVRTITVSDSRLLLNGEPVFLTGFGKHEDFPIHGKGLDLPVLVRDFELLKWIGANSFRTSHYPYAEEALMLADEYGFLVIAETPGVSLVFMDPPEVLDARHRQLSADLKDMVGRDKNHPCIVLWSLANEPIPKPFHTTNDAPPEAVEAGRRFFADVFAQARKLDETRPVALVSVHNGPPEWVGQGDVICTNSYNGWYAASGRLDAAEATLEHELDLLRARHGDKPVIFTEFGADASAGVHSHPPRMWSEEYQADLIELYWRVLRKRPYVIGTHPWAFADFKTPQSIMRVGGLNEKGVFTRDRQPKLAATRLKALWSANRA